MRFVFKKTKALNAHCDVRNTQVPFYSADFGDSLKVRNGFFTTICKICLKERGILDKMKHHREKKIIT